MVKQFVYLTHNGLKSAVFANTVNISERLRVTQETLRPKSLPGVTIYRDEIALTQEVVINPLCEPCDQKKVTLSASLTLSGPLSNITDKKALANLLLTALEAGTFDRQLSGFPANASTTYSIGQ